MKAIFAFILLILSFQAICGVKSLWWNIGFNEYALVSTENPSQSQLDDTLQNYDWSQYDIVSLGEYVEGTLNYRSLQKLKMIFPYQKIINYNSSYGKSIYIFSKKSFDIFTDELDWASESLSLKDRSKYKKNLISKYGKMDTFSRKYIRITTDIHDKEYNFLFYHLNNPWPQFYKKIGKIRTAAEIILGINNPLFHQIVNIKNKLVSDLGAHYKDKNIVMMGDSNCPKSIKGIPTVCYRALDKILDVVGDVDNYDTFPAKFSKMYKKFPSVKIDHAQVSNNLINKTKTEVLGLVGSDHYALELTIF